MTTISLLLLALASKIKADDSFTKSSKIKNYFLLNNQEEGEDRYKLILSQTDKNTLQALLDNRDLPQEFSIKIKENYELFKQKLSENGCDLETIWRGIQKLALVDIALDRNGDNPQLIFESLNSTGMGLKQTDLIRNFVLMDVEPAQQEKLYKNYWHPMEKVFGQKNYSKYFEEFMRHYLTLKLRRVPKQDQVYAEFKDYKQSKYSQDENDIEALIKDIHKFSNYYRAMTIDDEKDKG